MWEGNIGPGGQGETEGGRDRVEGVEDKEKWRALEWRDRRGTRRGSGGEGRGKGGKDEKEGG